MSRMTLQQYNAANKERQRPSKPDKKKVLGAFYREVKRRLIKDGKIEDPKTRKPRFLWDWILPSVIGPSTGRLIDGPSGTVEADTRSQAKAKVKRLLGFRNKRLPSEIQLTGRPNVASGVDESPAKLAG